MAEVSYLWDSTGTGDGALTGYTETQVYEMFRALYTTDRHTAEGVLAGYLNQLAASGSSSPVTVASGGAVCSGFVYLNSSSTTVAVTSPVGGTTGLRVNIRADWSAQTVRAVVVKNTDGTSAAPALTQTAGTTWDIPIATGTITTGGAISLTDARDYAHMATALVYRRQGGSLTDWSVSGTTNYTPGESIIQAGAVDVTISSGTGTQAVTFGQAYGKAPLVQLTTYNAASSTKRKCLFTVESVSTTGFTIRGYFVDGSSTSTTVACWWEATGEV